MNPEQIRERITALQQQRDTLEREAQQYEQAARDKRAAMAQAKLDLQELTQNFRDAQVASNAQKALNAAESAREHAEAHAKSLAANNKAVENLRTELEQKLKLLDEKLAAEPKGE